MKTIKSKIVLSAICLVVVGVLAVGIISAVLTYTTTADLAKQSIHEVIDIGVKRVEWELQSYLNTVIDTGLSGTLDKDISVEEKQVYLDERAALHDLERGNFIAADGTGLDGNNYSEREYFQKAMKGIACVSEPTISKITGKISIIVAAPVHKNGDINGEVIGCVYFVPHEEFLNDVVRSLTVSENSTAYMIDKNGTTIAATDIERVKSFENLEEQAKTNSSLNEIASLHARMRNGETALEQIKGTDGQAYMTFAPLSLVDGWSLTIYAPVGDFMLGTNECIITIIVVTIVMIIVASSVSIVLGKRISEPVGECTKRIVSLENGELNNNYEAILTGDETQVLAEAAEGVAKKFQFIVFDIERVLDALINGNLGVDINKNASMYNGDYRQLIVILTKVKDEFSKTMLGIRNISAQVTDEAVQVANNAQITAQGATEQASAVEELVSTVADVNNKVDLNAKSCGEAKVLFNNVTTNATAVSQGVNDLDVAMNRISEASNKIKSIIGTIDDIAFQTNILALNAAVEAARAGEAGSGFSVVANEVRNLATRSQQAVQETAQFINEATSAVEQGVVVTKELHNAMLEVDSAIQTVSGVIDNIQIESEQQATMVAQINVGIEQISAVIQNNTATSEESAAASEDLSAQANVLSSLVQKYK